LIFFTIQYRPKDRVRARSEALSFFKPEPHQHDAAPVLALAPTLYFGHYSEKNKKFVMNFSFSLYYKGSRTWVEARTGANSFFHDRTAPT
jgi:hypothetical protein